MSSPRLELPGRLALLVILLGSSFALALPTTTQQGLVVSAHPLASEAGARVLAEGGNAVDALVATAFALAVVEPHSSGLGGGGFALLYQAKSREVVALDFREVAPAAANSKYFHRDGKYDPSLSLIGGRAVGVPGAVAGYTWLAQKHGGKRLSLGRLVAPAANLAREGFVGGPGHERGLKWGQRVLDASPEAAGVFRGKGGDAPHRIVQPALGELLVEIGEKGDAAFYKGHGAKSIVEAVAAAGGKLSLKDLSDYKVRVVKPLEGSYRGHRVVTFPSPSAGGVTVLHTLAGMELLFPEAPPFRSVQGLHGLVELWKRSYAARAEFLGDARHEKSVAKDTARLLSSENLKRWVKSIDPARATPANEVSALTGEPKGGEHTTHLVAMDSEGNVAMMTSTLNGSFGSGVFVPELGLLLNNQLDDFAAEEGGNLYGLVGGEKNRIAPGKTPLSTMAPTLVFRGDQPFLAVGAPGGSTIATTVAQIVLNVVDYGMDAQQAVSASRLHAQHLPEVLRVEAFGMEDATAQGLRELGHNVVLTSFQWGNAMVVRVDEDGRREGAADPRGDGAAVAQDALP